MSRELIEEVYRSMPYGRLASTITEIHPDIRISDRLIEDYISIAERRQFKLDPVISEVRKMNKFDLPEFGYIDFILGDDSHIIISEECFQDIIEYSSNIPNLEGYISESKHNFLKVLRIINNIK